MSSAAEPYPTPRTLEDAETERLYAAYAGRILAYCIRRLRSRSDAEDAVQTTFLYAMRALRRGVEPECESAWLYTIARNVCSWHQRTAARRCPAADDFELESLACAESVEDVERLAGLREALQSLPARQREALVLREWHGVPAREIAVELGLTGPQTHALLTRARHALAQALTAPGKAALGLGALVVGVRAYFKALLGGVSIKAATVTVIAVTGAGVTGVTGAAAEESPAERAARERALVISESGTSDGDAVRDRTRQVPGERTSSTPAAAVPAAPELTGPALEAAPSEPAAAEPPRSRPVLEVAPVTVDLPTKLLPPLELPPVEVPPVELPVQLPELPVEVPPVEVEVPPIQIPAPTAGDPPLLDIPQTEIVLPLGQPKP